MRKTCVSTLFGLLLFTFAGSLVSNTVVAEKLTTNQPVAGISTLLTLEMLRIYGRGIPGC